MPHYLKKKLRRRAYWALGGVICAFAAILLVRSGWHRRHLGGNLAGGVRLDIDERRLSNGLKVYFVENSTTPVVSFQTWVRAGSVDEPTGKTGMAHMFEHLMFKGTSKYPEKEFFNRLEAKGAEVNAYTVRDYTVFYENMTPDLLPIAIDMEADRLAHLKVSQELLDTERLVVLEERRLRTDNAPAGRMNEDLWKLAFRAHPYHWPVIGEPVDLMHLQASDLQAFFDEYYQPGNVALVVVGAFDKDKTYDLIQKAYGVIPGRPRKTRKVPEEPVQLSEQRYVIHDTVASERFLHGYHVTQASDPDSYALDVLAQIAFAGTSSRAYRSLVEDKQTALGVSGSAYTPTFPGLFVISVTMLNGHPASDGEEALDAVLDRIKDEGVTQEEVQAAVKQLTVNLLDDVRTPHGMGELIGTVVMVLGDASQATRDLEKYQRVTREDVKRVAIKYLNPNNRSVVTLTPGPAPATEHPPEQAHGHDLREGDGT
ncbi:MAG TPA: pitrilysin family protein [Bdellovibrionota bacterium]|jgi:zinc protease|nr:pitrilysin family protein [Bdellovibrionota bacterium]